MDRLYSWLMFFHLLGVASFFFARGFSAAAALMLRGPVSVDSRKLLKLGQTSNFVSNPSLLVIVVTGIWMAFAGHWWGQVWPWGSVVVLVAVIAAMFYIARPYYQAREAATQSDDVVAQPLARTRPIAALWIGGAGIVILVFLMVLKPF